MEDNLRDDDGLSPTRAIYLRLKPLWRAGSLDDQDWVYILVCLRKIELGQERRCKECRDLTELKRRTECMECIERKLIESI